MWAERVLPLSMERGLLPPVRRAEVRQYVSFQIGYNPCTLSRGSLFFNDLWGLDLYKQGWVELSTRKNPIPRAFHSAFVDSHQQMLLLGGVRDTQANPAPADIYKLDLKAGRFFKLGYYQYIDWLPFVLCSYAVVRCNQYTATRIWFQASAPRSAKATIHPISSPITAIS